MVEQTYSLLIGNFSRLAVPENWAAWESLVRVSAGVGPDVQLTFTIGPILREDIYRDDVRLTVTFDD